MNTARIFLIGLSGSGKSTIARLVAERLGWDVADTDEMIASAAGKPVAQIFADEGEAQFRLRERLVLEQVSRLDDVVIATGGGAPTTPEGREAIGRGFVVWLAVSPERAAARLEGNPATEERPLLQGDLRSRLGTLLQARQAIYELADAAVAVDHQTPEQVAGEVVRLWEEARAHGGAQSRQAETEAAPSAIAGVAATVTTPTASYPVVVRQGALGALGESCRALGLGGRPFVVTDDNVEPLFGGAAASALRAGGYEPIVIAIPAGEEHKTMATLETVYDRMLEARVERSDFVVCLGGGVVTDLGGFAAATILRGVDFVHVPTTLLSMVDAAIGGKVAVDHPRGKNMVGVFAQPRAVIVDPEVLQTLPARQIRSGWAEAIKHGLILDEGLVRDLEAGAGDPAAMMSADLIARSVAIKAAVVSEDEREAGRRTLLNYGHTIGHAIEAVTGYSGYLHGEAVAVGMHAAGLIAVELGILSREALERQQALIRAYGLPDSARGLPVDAVIEATRVDKKVRAGGVRWVLLEAIGRAVARADVPAGVVRRAVGAVLH